MKQRGLRRISCTMPNPQRRLTNQGCTAKGCALWLAPRKVHTIDCTTWAAYYRWINNCSPQVAPQGLQNTFCTT
eukprot:3855029-Pyramimonas_sp.AAC.1